jgi:hypothetical protein
MITFCSTLTIRCTIQDMSSFWLLGQVRFTRSTCAKPLTAGSAGSRYVGGWSCFISAPERGSLRSALLSSLSCCWNIYRECPAIEVRKPFMSLGSLSNAITLCTCESMHRPNSRRSWPGENVSAQTKRAVAVAMQITIGDIGAIAGYGCPSKRPRQNRSPVSQCFDLPTQSFRKQVQDATHHCDWIPLILNLGDDLFDCLDEARE